MAVSKEEILHIAKLSDLKIAENEIDEYAKNLEEILDFMKVLDSVNTENIENSIEDINTVNVFRKDEIKEFEDKKSLLQNAPDSENNMFKIPKVI